MKNKSCVGHIYFLTILMLCSCARKTTPVAVENYTTAYSYSPKESAYTMDSGIKVRVQNPETYQDEIGVEITIENQTRQTIELDPGNWQYLAHYPKSNDPSFGYLVNPVIRLDEIEKNVKAQKGFWWKRTLAAATLISAGIVTNAALQNYDDEAGMKTASEGIDNIASISDDAKKLKESNQTLSYWKDVLFLPCKLAPGESRQGLIFFPIDTRAAYYELYIVAKGESITSRINQLLVN